MRWKAIIKKEKLLKSESFNWSIKAWVVLPRKYYPAFQYCYLIFCYSILTDFDGEWRRRQKHRYLLYKWKGNLLVKINHNDLNLFGVGINWWSKCSSFARFFFAIFSIKIYWVNSYYHIEKEIRGNVKNKV